MKCATRRHRRVVPFPPLRELREPKWDVRQGDQLRWLLFGLHACLPSCTHHRHSPSARSLASRQSSNANTAASLTVRGGAIRFARNLAGNSLNTGEGGAIHTSSVDTVTFNAVTFTGNKASMGGAVCAEGLLPTCWCPRLFSSHPRREAAENQGQTGVQSRGAMGPVQWRAQDEPHELHRAMQREERRDCPESTEFY